MEQVQMNFYQNKFEPRRLGTNPLSECKVESEEKVDKEKRYMQIIKILEENKYMTAKEIAVEMFNKGYVPTTDRNFSSPRLTELMQMGKVEPLGKKKCSYTNKTVTVFKIRGN